MKKLLYFLCIGGWLMPMCGNNQPSLDSDHIYAVILAGGSGERLWPLSCLQLPKQLLSIDKDRTLLDQAIDRIASLVPSTRIFVSTTQQYATSIQKSVGDRIGGIIIEPVSRNTGPAIVYCCMKLWQQDKQAVVVFLPADSYIPAKTHFTESVCHALDYVLDHDRIALLGLKPRYPATGYGYIKYDKESASGDKGLLPVKKIHEKPSYEIAQSYVDAGNMLWNIGIFCAKVEVFLGEFKRHAPKLYQGVLDALHDVSNYQSIISESIDYAVLEKSDRISVLPADFSWWDVGNLEVFLSLKKQEQPRDSRVVSYEAKNNLIDVPDKLVAIVGVDDLCVIDTGHVLLITKRQEAENVKKIVQELKDTKAYEYL